MTNILGYPRIGEKRELKKATESYWKGNLSREELLKAAASIRKTNWECQRSAGIDLISSNDFSFYDSMLDMSCLLGVVPRRFNWQGDSVDLDLMFKVARGTKEQVASEMTKWFDTNYHYIVPELDSQTKFKISASKVFDEFKEALALGIKTKPVLIGPITYLRLSKAQDAKNPKFQRFSLLPDLIDTYVEILKQLSTLGAEWVQIDEPVFALDMSDAERQAALNAYLEFAKAAPQLKVMVANYFGELRDNLPTFLQLPVDALHIDVTRGGGEFEGILKEFPEDVLLSIGVVDGRNIWRNDLEASLAKLKQAKAALGGERVLVASSCSLIHSPVTLRNEVKLDEELKGWMSFAEEKLTEVALLHQVLIGKAEAGLLDASKAAIAARKASKRIHNDEVKQRAVQVTASDTKRQSIFANREKAQRDKLKLPLFPTTTIGSFPQTKEVRQMRAKFKKGEIDLKTYEAYLEAEIKKSMELQNEIGIDVQVHGEFERNDMVEYFGELLEGFVFTQFGWVQSYGSRYVKPPVIFGDVWRAKPMTVRWSKVAKGMTDRPIKGMLTGPVTIMQWSFVRDDQPRKETVNQIALALRDEVVDLESAGIVAIQIDEPAFREGLPLRRADWEEYLQWAAAAFRLSSSGVKDETQIHTHMCYAEFNDIIQAIADLDADVISVETSRSNMELLEAFVNFKYPNEIGPGVYDIHSPRIPSVEEIDSLLHKAEKVLPVERIWVNPDCGLKTRQWDEVVPALKNMVASAKKLRASHQVHSNS